MYIDKDVQGEGSGNRHSTTYQKVTRMMKDARQFSPLGCGIDGGSNESRMDFLRKRSAAAQHSKSKE
jgi:hypothetical protein